jgi:septal ring factor EnvC (AmiA/AmiB activator)
VLSVDDVPDWARTLVTLALGAGGAKVLAVVLENRRLTRRDYRETLEERIRDLERQVAGLFERVGSLRVEVAHLEEELKDESERSERLNQENARLRARLLEAEDDPRGELGG